MGPVGIGVVVVGFAGVVPVGAGPGTKTLQKSSMNKYNHMNSPESCIGLLTKRYGEVALTSFSFADESI